MSGLYLESVVLLHQLSTNTNVRTNLVNQLTRSVNHLFNDTYEKNDPVTNFPHLQVARYFYYWGGALSLSRTNLVHRLPAPPPAD